MRLYLTKGTQGETEKALEFTGNQVDAAKSVRELSNGTRGTYSSVYWEVFDIPTDKIGLLNYLNLYTKEG